MDKITKTQTTATTAGQWIQNAGTLTAPVTQAPVTINKAEYGLVAEAPKKNPVYSNLVREVREDEVGTLEAAFKSNNVGYNLYGALTKPDFAPDTQFNILDHETELIGFEDNLSDLAKVKSLNELRYVQKKILQERQAREVLDQAGTLESVGAQVVAGVLDLPTLIGGAAIKTGASVLANTARAVATESAITAASEVGLQQAQYTRTARESAENIALSAVGSAALYGSILGIKSRIGARATESDTIIRDAANRSTPSPELTDEIRFAPAASQQSIGAAAVTTPSSRVWNPEDTQLVGSKAINALAYAPSVDVLRSDFPAARDLVNRLVNHSFELTGHAAGKVARPVEAAINRQQVEFAIPIRTALSETEFKINKLRKDRGLPALTEEEFNQAVLERSGGFKRLLGGASAVFEPAEEKLLAQAGGTISKNLNRILDELASLDPKIRNSSIRKYFHLMHSNMYSSSAIKREQATFVEKITNKLSTRINDLSPEIQNKILDRFDTTDINVAAKNWAEQIKDTIVFDSGDFYKLKNTDIDTPLEIDDLSEWLVADAKEFANRFADTYIPRLEMLREFGTYDTKELLQPFVKEFDARKAELAAKFKGDLENKEFIKANKKLDREFDKIRDNVSLMVSNLKNEYRFSRSSYDGIINGISKLTAASKLGSALLSSLTDVAKQVNIDGVMGLKNNFNALRDTWNNSFFKNLPPSEMDSIVWALDDIKHNRTNSIAGIIDRYTNDGNWVMKSVDKASALAMKASGLPSWTKANKISAGYAAADKIKRIGNQLLAGQQPNARELIDLAKVGLDQDTLKSIAEQVNKYGKDRVFNVGSWDPDVSQAFREGLSRYVDKTINTAGAGDIPKLMQEPLGRLFFQFQSFAVLNWNQFIMSGLQAPDAKFLMAVIGTLGIAAFQLDFKSRVAGKKLPEEVDAEYAAMLVEESGLVSGPAILLNKTELFGVNVKESLSATPKEYHQSASDRVVSFLGPSAGYFKDAVTLATGAGTAIGEMAADRELDASAIDYKTVQAARAIVPGQNIWYLRDLFTTVQESIANGVGINNVKERETIADRLQSTAPFVRRAQ